MAEVRRALSRLRLDELMLTVIIAIHLMVVTTMIALVLLQKSEGGGLGIGGGGGFMTNRGAGNVLTRATAVLAGVFFATSLILSMLAGMDRKPRSILQNTNAPAGAPSTPGSPLSPSGRGTLDQLRGNEPAAPQPPAAPAPPRSQ